MFSVASPYTLIEKRERQQMNPNLVLRCGSAPDIDRRLRAPAGEVLPLQHGVLSARIRVFGPVRQQSELRRGAARGT